MSLVARLIGRLRWLWRSSTLRLTLLLSGIFAVGMAVAILVALGLGRDAVLNRVDTTLAGLAQAVEVGDAPEETFSVLIRPMDALGNLPSAFARAAERGGGTVDLDEDFRRSDEWRVIVSADSQATPVLIAVPLDDSADTLELLGHLLWITAALVIAVTLGIGFVAGFFAQRRVVRIRNTLDRLATGDLGARTGIARSVDDLDDIARQLDLTAAQLERLVAQTRNLSASLAHDLRTPLARLRAQLEMLPDGDERGAALDEAARLSGVFDAIMRVARIEAAQGTDGFEAIDLSAFLADIAETFGPVIEDHNKRLIVSDAGGATCQADRDMLVQAMANLIQNALVYGGDDITVFVRGRQIGVADNGEGVDPAEFAEIIKPMVRLDGPRQSDGTGLGLALVRAVADRHGAELTLSKNTPSGLRVTLSFADL